MRIGVAGETMALRRKGTISAGKFFLQLRRGVRKKIKAGTSTLFATILLLQVGCGGGSSSSGAAQSPPAPPPTPSPAPSPEPPASSPADPDETNVPVFGWITVPPTEGSETEAASVTLSCAGDPVLGEAFLVDEALIFNPSVDLPAESICELLSSSGERLWTVETAGLGTANSILYDRDTSDSLAPLPDDLFLRSDSSTITGVSPQIPSPRFENEFAQSVVDNLLAQVSEGSGWSPHGPITIGLAQQFDADNLPRSFETSMAADAAIQLFELSGATSATATRVPFTAQLRDDPNAEFPSDITSLSIFPARVLAGGARYGLVITRFLGSDSTAALDASDSFATVLAAPNQDDTQNIIDARQITNAALEDINGGAAVMFDQNDLALLLRFTVRDRTEVTESLEQLRDLADSFPIGGLDITEVSSRLNVFRVRGTWTAPDFRDPLTGALARDADGVITQTGLLSIPFVLTVPSQSNGAFGAPLIMVQHGNPGDSEQVISVLESYADSDGNTLSARGFAGIGFTDAENRENPVGGDGSPSFVIRALEALQSGQPLGDETLQSIAEQLVFVRLLKTLGALDVLPPRNGASGGDGVPDLDVSSLLYYGGSEGANKGFSMLPFQSDIDAAALSVGGTRVGEALVAAGNINSGAFLQSLKSANIDVSQTTAFAGAALLQQALDKETSASYARFYSSEFDTRPSLLIQEGLDDSFVPNRSTRVTTAAVTQVAQVAPLLEPVSLLASSPAPLVANVSDGSTAGLVQFAPAGLAGIEASQGCEAQEEGHFCAQDGTAAVAQLISFFESVLDSGNAAIVASQ
ncbi:MAG: hypothetical protein AAF098_04820 [Pseudomonadota bacterium]